MPDPLDAKQLRAFSALARTSSFTRAARELNLSQSAVSHAIKALEGEVRCRLFDRMGKKVTLTQAGEQFLMHVQRILSEMEAARQGLDQLGKWGQSRLRLGATLTACQYILPAVLREFKESFPQCVLQIEPRDTAEIVESLRNRRIDLAVTIQPNEEPQFAFRPLFTDELHFIVNPLHPWAVAKRVERSDIVRQRYISYTHSSYMSAMTRDYFRADGMVLPTTIELGNIEAIKELVKVGVGISILAPWVARQELAEGSLVSLPLGRRKLKRRWGIIHWQQRALTLAEETFVGLCETVAAELGSRVPKGN